MNGLLVVNLELTSRCNKNCWMCGRRKIDMDYPEIKMNYGDMDFSLVESLSRMVPDGVLVQFHSNGEPLLYPRLGEALSLFHGKIRCLDTNGKLLLSKADEIIGNLDTITISVIENDEESDAQYDIVSKFVLLKGDKKPFMVYRLLGNVENRDRWGKLPGLIVTRTLHNPLGSFGYEKKVTIPEHGICLDLLGHLVIDRHGNVYPCIRFNPNRYNLLGNVKFLTLEQMWNGEIRSRLVREHVAGNRNCSELCSKCEFYGCPVS